MTEEMKNIEQKLLSRNKTKMNVATVFMVVMIFSVLAAFFIYNNTSNNSTSVPIPEPTFPIREPGIDGIYGNIFIVDNAGILSNSAKEYIISHNLSLYELTASKKVNPPATIVVAVAEPNGADIVKFGEELFEYYGISNNGALILISPGADDYCIIRGYDATFLTDSRLDAIFDVMEGSFAARKYESAVMSAYTSLLSLYESNYNISVTAKSGSYDYSAYSDQYNYTQSADPFGFISEATTVGMGIARVTFTFIFFVAVVIIIVVIVSAPRRRFGPRQRYYHYGTPMFFFGRPRRHRHYHFHGYTPPRHHNTGFGPKPGSGFGSPPHSGSSSRPSGGSGFGSSGGGMGRSSGSSGFGRSGGGMGRSSGGSGRSGGGMGRRR